MCSEQNYILQLADLVTGRRCALRIDASDSGLPLAKLLDKYLKHCPIDQLLGQGRITEESAETLPVLQDLVYITTDTGQLRGMYAGMAFQQNGLHAEPDSPPTVQSAHVGDTEVALIDVAVDRMNVGYDRNWVGFHRRRWDRHADQYLGFVQEALGRKHSESEADAILQLDSQDQKVKLVGSLARRIWESEFENYSRFTGKKLPYKTGDETVRNIMDGAGGICSEKVQALKFLTDHFGISSQYLLAGADASGPVPEEKLRELLTTFDFRFSKRYMRYWQHIALMYSIDGAEVLVDVTNGNVPFLFLQGEDAQLLLGYEDKPAVQVKMAVHKEDFYYHKVSQSIPKDLYFAMEGWIADADLIQVFDNELGLFICPDFFVAPIVYRSGQGYQRLRQQYVDVCDRAGLECYVGETWSLATGLGEQFTDSYPRVAESILLARNCLLERYDECHGPDHEAGLVVIALGATGDELRDT